jgi:hypothetical protein
MGQGDPGGQHQAGVRPVQEAGHSIAAKTAGWHFSAVPTAPSNVPADICSMRVLRILNPRSGLPLEEFSIILSAKPIVISACRSSISRLQLHERFE